MPTLMTCRVSRTYTQRPAGNLLQLQVVSVSFSRHFETVSYAVTFVRTGRWEVLRFGRDARRDDSIRCYVYCVWRSVLRCVYVCR